MKTYDIPEETTQSLENIISHFEAISANDHDFILKLAAFLPAHLAPLRNTPYTTPMKEPVDVFKNGFADCGHKEWLFQEILLKKGFECRRISFAALPIQLGHSATEVKLDGQWMFIDAAFGMYFSGEDDDVPISMAEARCLYPNITRWKVRDPIFLGKPEKGYSLSWLPTVKNRVVDPDNNDIIALVDETYFLSRVYGAEALAHDSMTPSCRHRNSFRTETRWYRRVIGAYTNGTRYGHTWRIG